MVPFSLNSIPVVYGFQLLSSSGSPVVYCKMYPSVFLLLICTITGPSVHCSSVMVLPVLLSVYLNVIFLSVAVGTLAVSISISLLAVSPFFPLASTFMVLYVLFWLSIVKVKVFSVVSLSAMVSFPISWYFPFSSWMKQVKVPSPFFMLTVTVIFVSVLSISMDRILGFGLVTVPPSLHVGSPFSSSTS